MNLSAVTGARGTQGGFRSATVSIPGLFLSKQNLAAAADSLRHLAQAALLTGSLPASDRDPQPDAEASLWLIRASHLFALAGGDPELSAKLLDCSKRILQEFISEKGVGGVTMDHGGLLMVSPGKNPAEALRFNALWYSALESTAEDLRKAQDPSGDHFERLAGRFRRTFVKTYWCEGHNRICPPHARENGSHGEIPDADQLLLTILPVSPVPRTKQRQLIQAIFDRGIAPPDAVGVLVDHPRLGRVESAIHRAWLAVGLLNSADNRTAAVPDARAILRPLQPMVSAGLGIAEFYRNGAALGDGPDLATTAEVLDAINQVG